MRRRSSGGRVKKRFGFGGGGGAGTATGSGYSRSIVDE